MKIELTVQELKELLESRATVAETTNSDIITLSYDKEKMNKILDEYCKKK